MKISKKRLVLAILIAVLLLVAVYLTFFYYRKCSDKACFKNYLVECKRTRYLEEAQDASWLYSIKGKSGDECKVEVKLLQLKQGTTEIAGLEGKSMLCYLPLSYGGNPQENLARCTGKLKEEMLTLMLNKAYKYITDNLGRISEELQKVI